MQQSASADLGTETNSNLRSLTRAWGSQPDSWSMPSGAAKVTTHRGQVGARGARAWHSWQLGADSAKFQTCRLKFAPPASGELKVAAVEQCRCPLELQQGRPPRYTSVHSPGPQTQNTSITSVVCVGVAHHEGGGPCEGLAFGALHSRPHSGPEEAAAARHGPSMPKCKSEPNLKGRGLSKM